MTNEEKNKVIQEYCKLIVVEYNRVCTNCKIKKLCDICAGDFINNPKELDQAYQILKDKPHIKGEDIVNHPSHYTQGGMECIDEMILVFGKEVVAHFCLCNVWKYRKRALLKGGQTDIDKSDWYMNKYKELILRDFCSYGEPKEV